MRFLIVALLLAFPAHAQCWKAQSLEEMESEGWIQRVSHAGITKDGEILRLYVNPEDGAWTLTVIQKTGHECPLAAGEGWRQLKVPGHDA